MLEKQYGAGLETGQIDHVTVHRKVTHTEKYVAFDSHHPINRAKVAVVKT